MESIKEITLGIENHTIHGKLIDNLELENQFSEIDGFVTYYDLSIDQSKTIASMVRDGVYEVRSDSDKDLCDKILEEYSNGFQEIEVIPGSEYKTFEDYYEHKKHDYLHGNSDKQRETKRIHEGFGDLVRSLSLLTGAKNNTAITTMLLSYGAIQYCNLIPKDKLELIGSQFNQHAPSSFIHTEYENGIDYKHRWSLPVRRYTNSRSTVLNMNEKSTVIHYYQDEFVFKTLEGLNILGFKGRKSSYGYELLLGLALEKSTIFSNDQLQKKLRSLTEPTIDSIQNLIDS